MANNLLNPTTKRSDVSQLRFRPKGAAPCQPRATPWVTVWKRTPSPERATRPQSNNQSIAPSGLPKIRWVPRPRALPWAGILLPRWGEDKGSPSPRDLLLPRLISGELDVSELPIEVEEAARDGE